MKKFFIVIVIASSFVASQAMGTNISVQSGGITLNSYDTTKAGTLADPWLINETMISLGTLILQNPTGGRVLTAPSATGTHSSGDWFQKTVINNTGQTWTSFELELQVILGTPSPDGDGLSFAQGGGLVFSSDQFSTYTRIDTTKDYLNFHGGDVLNGESVTFLFAITDNQVRSTFYLLETPNKIDQPVPEPATMLLLGSGLIGLAGFARRRFRK